MGDTCKKSLQVRKSSTGPTFLRKQLNFSIFKMSEDEREIDIESEDEDGNSRGGRHGSGEQSTDKRAHHNALERKRRDHIKDSFSSLRDAIPTMQGDKSSRAQILKKASDYITHMRRRNQSHQQDIEDLKRQNSHLA